MVISLERNEIDERFQRTNCQVYVSTCEFIIKIFFKITLVEFHQIESDSILLHDSATNSAVSLYMKRSVHCVIGEPL